MDRHEAPIQPRPSRVRSGHRPRVVVKFRDDDGPFPDGRMAAAPGNPTLLAPRQLEELRERFPEIVVERLFSSTPREDVRRMVRDARSARAARVQPGDEGRTREIPELDNFYSVKVPSGTDPQEVIAAAQGLPDVEVAYLQGRPTPPPVKPEDDPRSADQGYLDDAPDGIGVRSAWVLDGGDGSGVDFVDLEQGWTLDHVDLIDAGITPLPGFNDDLWAHHGTAVLGIVLAQDNQLGGVGIAPAVRARVVSQARTSDPDDFSTGDAITCATDAMRAGDILLLEAQTQVGNSNYLPVEVEYDVRAAIITATSKGIIVVEAAGNGGTDLDTYDDPIFGFILCRGHDDYIESGAIMVAAATSTHPHARFAQMPQPSNFGSRIDCYAWGENIDTAGGETPAPQGNETTAYTTSFGCTSGASAIVAGAAVALQGIVKAGGSQSWSPEHMRTALSNPNVNTSSANPAVDRIGVMPNLGGIIAAELLAPAPSPHSGVPPHASAAAGLVTVEA